MTINKSSLQRLALLALSLELLTAASFPMLAEARSLNREGLAPGKVSEHPTRLPGVRVGMFPFQQARLRFRIPKVGRPRRQEAAAVRGGCSNASEEKLVALLPTTDPVLTVASYPTIFVSLPQTSAKQAEFLLLDAKNGQVVYETTLTLPNEPGIVSISLPNNGNIPPLKEGTSYHWYFSVICNPQDRADDVVAEGQIQRVQPSASLAAKLQSASPRDRAALYAEEGIWYDSVTTLAQLRRSSPNNTAIATDWTELLDSVGLNTISQKPLIQ